MLRVPLQRFWVTGLPDRVRFLEDVTILLDDPAQVASETAVLVIDAATPNQFAELERTLGPADAESFEVATANRIGELLPEGIKLYHLSTARFGSIITPDTAGEIGEFLDGLA